MILSHKVHVSLVILSHKWSISPGIPMSSLVQLRCAPAHHVACHASNPIGVILAARCKGQQHIGTGPPWSTTRARPTAGNNSRPWEGFQFPSLAEHRQAMNPRFFHGHWMGHWMVSGLRIHGPWMVNFMVWIVWIKLLLTTNLWLFCFIEIYGFNLNGLTGVPLIAADPQAAGELRGNHARLTRECFQPLWLPVRTTCHRSTGIPGTIRAQQVHVIWMFLKMKDPTQYG